LTSFFQTNQKLLKATKDYLVSTNIGAKKTIEAYEFLITHLTNNNDVVLDPFLGSGLIARKCLELNRKLIGFDINPLSIELTKF
jgi:DNA modification methylase